MESTLAFINDIGTTIKGSFTTLITLNYVLGRGLVAIARRLWQCLLDFVFTLVSVIQVLLEDLAVFLLEVTESVAFILEGLSAGVDAVISGIGSGLTSIFQFVFNFFNNFCACLSWTLKSVYGASDLIGKSLSHAVSLLISGIRAIPYSLCQLMFAIYVGFKSGLEAVGSAGRSLYSAVEAAPFEALVGFVAASMFMYLSFRTAKRIIHERQITSRHVAHWSFNALCILYFFFINFLVGCIRNLFRTVEFTLGHLHVPRFHHAGDSDVEDEEVDTDTIPAEALDDSDAEEDERLDRRRRNYEFLIRRRNERRSKSKAKTDEVEDLLFEQVEREREDKLCVICQDQEKCIMILPCRHLCICQNCQINLLQRNNHAHSGTCPICRKNVKQTIKAYL